MNSDPSVWTAIGRPWNTWVQMSQSFLVCWDMGWEVDLLSELPFSDKSHMIGKGVGELEGWNVFSFSCWVHTPDWVSWLPSLSWDLDTLFCCCEWALPLGGKVGLSRGQSMPHLSALPHLSGTIARVHNSGLRHWENPKVPSKLSRGYLVLVVLALSVHLSCSNLFSVS